MLDLVTTLREIVAGLADPSFEDVAKITQELLAKQVKQSWQDRHDQNQDAWAGTKQSSFAGISKRFPGRKWGRAVLDMAAAADIKEGTVDDTGFETRGTLPFYWAWQNDGTDSTGFGPPIPAREFWAFGDDMLDLVNELLAEKAAKKFAGV